MFLCRREASGGCCLPDEWVYFIEKAWHAVAFFNRFLIGGSGIESSVTVVFHLLPGASTRPSLSSFNLHIVLAASTRTDILFAPTSPSVIITSRLSSVVSALSCGGVVSARMDLNCIFMPEQIEVRRRTLLIVLVLYYCCTTSTTVLLFLQSMSTDTS